MEELKPCPSCGGEAGAYMRYDYPPRWAIACSKCGIESPLTFGSYDYAIKMWNRRAFVGLWKRRPPESPGHHMVLD